MQKKGAMPSEPENSGLKSYLNHLLAAWSGASVCLWILSFSVCEMGHNNKNYCLKSEEKGLSPSSARSK